MEVQCTAGGLHIAQDFSIIDAQSSMPDHRTAIHRKKNNGCAICNRGGGKLHRLFQSSMPDHRCPIHRKNMEVQFSAGGLQIAQAFPIIDAQFFGHAH